MISAEHAHLHVAAATHPGVKGKPNEDRYSVLAYRSESDDRKHSLLALLADGIGGHHGGEIAAELAVKHISKYVLDNRSGLPTQILSQAFARANQAIISYSRKDSSLAGMGTTCVCAWVIDDQLFVAYVGDSRLYLQRGAELIRLTNDHTWIQEALNQGTLNPEQVAGHPNAHIIRRFLGSVNAFAPDLRLRLDPAESDEQSATNQGLRLLPEDRLMLCSDGLTDLVRDAEILEILRSNQLDLSPARLIDRANQRGGHDNITVVLLEVPQSPEFSQLAVKEQSKQSPAHQVVNNKAARWMVILLLLAIFMLGLLLIFFFVR